MKKLIEGIKKAYWETPYFNFLKPVKYLKDAIEFNYFTDRKYLQQEFKKRLGYDLDLKKPTTFNQKMQWLKLYDRSPLHTQCADKLAVREIVKQVIGEQYLIPLLGTYSRPKDIDFDNLEYPCVIKTNHNSGEVFLYTNKDDVVEEDITFKLNNSLRNNYYFSSREWQYKNIAPQIVVERMIFGKNKTIPNDFKVYCFNGSPRFIHVDTDRFGAHRRTFFDLNWNRMELKIDRDSAEKIDKPRQLKLILQLAEKLSQPFSFSRIDFYETDSAVFFGEITFHPDAGFNKFHDKLWDQKLGDMLTLKKTTSY